MTKATIFKGRRGRRDGSLEFSPSSRKVVGGHSGSNFFEIRDPEGRRFLDVKHVQEGEEHYVEVKQHRPNEESINFDPTTYEDSIQKLPPDEETHDFWLGWSIVYRICHCAARSTPPLIDELRARARRAKER